MGLLDLFLSFFAPLTILLHLVIAPYTKVEESFTLQATHDILHYGVPIHNSSILYSHFDHMSFPGAVPRSFVGPLILAEASRVVRLFIGNWVNEQLIVRGTLGIFTSLAIIYYTHRLRLAHGPTTSRFYLLFQLTQFHIPFYASRTLPNTFALIITLISHASLLPLPSTPSANRNSTKFGLYLLTIGGIIFRAELGLLLIYHLLTLLLTRRATLHTILPPCIAGALVGLTATLSIDSFFWQTLPSSPKPAVFSTTLLTPKTGLIWPELSSFLFNFLSGHSSEWGTSPWHYYLTSSLPKLLLNPLHLLLLPTAFLIAPDSTLRRATPLAAFIATYSLLPHKEWRFIIYALPDLTAISALAATWLWTRRGKPNFLTKTFFPYRLGSLAVMVSIPVSAVLAGVMLYISSLNYPGGVAIGRLHSHLIQELHDSSTSPSTRLAEKRRVKVKVHLDVPTCMTGATRFLQSSPLLFSPTTATSSSSASRLDIEWDKTEPPSPQLLSPEWWDTVDYAVMEEPGLAVGKWGVVERVDAFGRVRVLRSGE
ncbi:hypothetical protein EX30DRAFT_318662, partial [Ascodesmis nigricans]